MIAEGLLWFDDDLRRPFSAKMAEAAHRFSERTGWAPTACEAHPQTLAQRGATVVVAAKVGSGGRASRAKKASPAPIEEADPLRLRVTANASLRPNFILVGVEAGKTPRPARRERAARVTRASARGRSAPSAPRVSA